MKLFRRLSGKAPRPDSLWSYLRYAAGEITLVVAGILIAVSLNNWNEKRKDAAALDQILTTVVADLQHDMKETAAALRYYDERKPTFERVLAGTVSEKDYEESPSLAYLLIGYPQVSFQKRGFDQLNNFRGTIPANRRQLVDEVISFYTERAVEVSVDDKLRADDFAENLSHFKANTTWWSHLINQSEVTEFIPYALHDPDYRNRVATTHFLGYRVFVPELEKAEIQATGIIDAIQAAMADD